MRKSVITTMVAGMVVGSAAGILYGKISSAMPKRRKMMRRAERALRAAGSIVGTMTGWV